MGGRNPLQARKRFKGHEPTLKGRTVPLQVIDQKVTVLETHEKSILFQRFGTFKELSVLALTEVNA